MSSLIEASGNERNSLGKTDPVSGNILTSHAIPKRRWSGSSFTSPPIDTDDAILTTSTTHIYADPDIKMPLGANGSNAQSMTDAKFSSSTFQWKTPDNQDMLELESREKNKREKLEEFISLLTASRSKPGQPPDDMDKRLDDLITVMKAHTVSDDQLQPTNGDTYSKCTSFESDLTPKGSQLTRSIPFDTPSDQIAQAFQFSFAASLPNTEAVDFSPFPIPHKEGQSPQRRTSTTTMHWNKNLNGSKGTSSSAPSQASHLCPPQEERLLVQGSGQDEMSLLAADTYASGSFDYLNHRKILPLPKPRWKRKLSKAQNGQHRVPSNDDNSHTTELGKYSTGWSMPAGAPPLAPYVWQFTPPAQELQRAYALPAEEVTWIQASQEQQQQQQQFSDFGSDTGSVDRAESFGGGNASYRDSAKKMKRSANGQSNEFTQNPEEDKKSMRRKELAQDKQDVNQPPTTGPSPFPQTDFNFTIPDSSKRLPKYEELPPALPYLTLYKTANAIPSSEPPSQTNVLFHTDKPLTNRSRTSAPPMVKGVVDKTQAISNTVKSSPLGNYALPTTAKKAGKPGVFQPSKSEDSLKPNRVAPAEKPPAQPSSASKKGKSGQRKKKVEEDSSGTSMGLQTSNVAIVQSPDPDEWVCLFCQFEIFVHDLESARRKGGYYRRLRDRRRRLREAEARRNGETMLATSDFEDEEPLPQPGGMAVATDCSIADHHQKPLRRGHRAG